jgi:hypothetical protein
MQYPILFSDGCDWIKVNHNIGLSLSCIRVKAVDLWHNIIYWRRDKVHVGFIHVLTCFWCTPSTPLWWQPRLWGKHCAGTDQHSGTKAQPTAAAWGGPISYHRQDWWCTTIIPYTCTCMCIVETVIMVMHHRDNDHTILLERVAGCSILPLGEVELNIITRAL